MKRLTIEIPDKVHKALKAKAVDRDTSMVQLILDSLQKDKIITKEQAESE